MGSVIVCFLTEILGPLTTNLNPDDEPLLSLGGWEGEDTQRHGAGSQRFEREAVLPGLSKWPAHQLLHKQRRGHPRIKVADRCTTGIHETP